MAWIARRGWRERVRNADQVLSIIGFGSHPHEEQGISAPGGVSLSDHVLDRIAEPNGAADGLNSGGLPRFARDIMVLLIFRPNLLCSV
jgi:hypothetical protein